MRKWSSDDERPLDDSKVEEFFAGIGCCIEFGDYEIVIKKQDGSAVTIGSARYWHDDAGPTIHMVPQ